MVKDIIFPVAAVAVLGLTLGACMSEAEIADNTQRDQKARAGRLIAAVEDAPIACRDGVEYMVGWVGGYDGGPFATPHLNLDGSPYTCGQKHNKGN